MNGRERLLTALSGGKPDRVPVFDYIDEELMHAIGKLRGIQVDGLDEAKARHKGEEGLASAELYCRIVEEFDLDGTWVTYGIGLERVSEDYAYDKYGRGFMLSTHGKPAVMEGNVNSLEDAAQVDMAALVDNSDFTGARYIIERLGPNRGHYMSINGPFQECWYMRGGLEKAMLDYIQNPELAHATARAATDFNKHLIDVSAKLGCDGICLDGDLAGNQYTLMSRDHFLEFIAPYKKETVDHIHSHNMKAIKHSDGFVWSLLQDIIDLGFDGFHPIQPQCMDIAETKSFCLDKICLFGNIDCLDLLVFKEPEDVVESVKDTINIAAQKGQYVLCSSNSLHNGCKPENAVAMFEAAKKYGQYADLELAMAKPLPEVRNIPTQGVNRPRRVNRRRKPVFKD